jgi:mannose-6-phosphate isomerase-like protein (cupin superfamily)
MRLRIFLLLASSTLIAAAADPEGFVYWPKGAPSPAPKFANHGLSVSHRDKDGVAEMHEKQTDIMVVQSGEAKLTVGGTLVGQTTASPGELRGTAIKDGVTKTLGAGDVIHIPSNMPHQFFIDKGKQITYFVVKVDNP